MWIKTIAPLILSLASVAGQAAATCELRQQYIGNGYSQTDVIGEQGEVVESFQMWGTWWDSRLSEYILTTQRPCSFELSIDVPPPNPSASSYAFVVYANHTVPVGFGVLSHDDPEPDLPGYPEPLIKFHYPSGIPLLPNNGQYYGSLTALSRIAAKLPQIRRPHHHCRFRGEQFDQPFPHWSSYLLLEDGRRVDGSREGGWDEAMLSYQDLEICSEIDDLPRGVRCAALSPRERPNELNFFEINAQDVPLRFLYKARKFKVEKEYYAQGIYDAKAIDDSLRRTASRLCATVVNRPEFPVDCAIVDRMVLGSGVARPLTRVATSTLEAEGMRVELRNDGICR